MNQLIDIPDDPNAVGLLLSGGVVAVIDQGSHRSGWLPAAAHTATICGHERNTRCQT
jgi:hypothetical protein